MQARQCTVALRRVLLDSLVCHRMENGASRTLIWKTPLHFCWLRNCKVTSTRDSRGSTTNVCAADRRPACILEELHDTPCPGLAIVPSLRPSTMPAANLRSLLSAGKQWDQNSRLGVGRHCQFPRRIRTLVTPRIHREATRPDVRPTILALHVSPREHGRCLGWGLARPQGGEHRRRRYHGNMMMRIALRG